MKALDVRPSDAIQGVDVFLAMSGSKRLHALVASEVLEQRFGCTANPVGWVSAYRENAASLELLIRQKYQAAPGKPVIVTLHDFALNKGTVRIGGSSSSPGA
jgi:hypothetical protein